MRTHLLTTVALGALLLSACGGGDADPTGEATSPGTDPADTADPTTDAPADPTEAAEGGVAVGTSSTDLGTVLVDGQGRTLYLFDNDSEGESACSGGCAETWPPLTGGEPEATGEVDPSLLGTTEREDGSVQVTYAGSPLYLYAADSAPGDVNGQGVGDVWWVVGPDGERVTDDAATSGGPDY